MTPEAQRIAIATACGWVFIENRYLVNECSIKELSGFREDPRPSWPLPERVPDYLNDLNAAHEMEKVLTYEQWETYAGHLAVFHQPLSAFQFLHATAAQRCEAFLRTLSLWTE